MTTQTVDLEQLYSENPIEYHNLILQDTLNNIDIAESKQLKTAEEATEARQYAMNEFNLRVFKELGYNVDEYENNDDEETEEQYSNDMDLATFASGSAVGSALVGLIQDEYETEEDGIEALSQATGYDTDTILGIISGEYVPDESLVEDMVQVFDLDEDEYVGLHYLASEARQDDIFGLQEIDDDEEDENDEEYDDEEYEEDETESEEYSRISELETQLANFQLQKDLKNDIDLILRDAEELVESGNLLPVEYNALFGQLPDCLDDEKVALFSNSCESNNIDLDTQLYSLRHYLKVAEKRGSLNMFGRIADNEASFSNQNSMSAQDKEIEKTARHTANYLFKQGNLRLSD